MKLEMMELDCPQVAEKLDYKETHTLGKEHKAWILYKTENQNKKILSKA